MQAVDIKEDDLEAETSSYHCRYFFFFRVWCSKLWKINHAMFSYRLAVLYVKCNLISLILLWLLDSIAEIKVHLSHWIYKLFLYIYSITFVCLHFLTSNQMILMNSVLARPHLVIDRTVHRFLLSHNHLDPQDQSTRVL